MNDLFRLRLPAVSLLALLLVPALPAQAPAPDGSVRFLAFGDWGRDGSDFQKPVAEQMGRTAAAERSQFVISLGDNFYDDGVPSVEARQWKTSFEDIYTAPSLQIPWYVMLGNHDYRTNVQAQLEYTFYSPRWKLPARYYTFTRRIDAENTAQFFVLDSSPYVAVYRAELKYKGVLDQKPGDQTAWLARELAKSTARWKIVCAHHPVFSCSGKHGDTPELIRDIEPLLVKHGVQVFLNGHEHDLQHLRVGPVDYFCSGAGSKTRPTARDDRTLFSLGDTGRFLAVTLTADEFHGRFIDYTGKEVYAVTRPAVPAEALSR